MRRLFLSLVSIIVSLFIVGIISAVGFPIIDQAISGAVNESTSAIIVSIFTIALLALIIIIARKVLDWLEKPESNDNSKVEPTRHSITKPAIFITVVVAIVFFYSLVYSTNRSTNFAYLLGQNLVFTTVLFVITTSLFSKYLSSPQKTGSFIILLASLMAGSYIAAERNLSADNRTIERIGKDISYLAEQADTEDRIQPLEVNREAYNSKNDNEIIEAWFTELVNSSIELRNDYNTELQVINFLALLDAERLKADTDFSETRFMIGRARSIIDKYEVLGSQLMIDGKARIETLNLSPSVKSDVLEGFESGLPNGAATNERLWEYERAVVTEMAELAEFLHVTQETWTLENDQFLFSTTKSLDVFNRHMAEIQRIVDEQTELQQATSQRTLDSLGQ